MKNKNMELQISVNKKFRFSLGLLGITSLSILLHSYLTKNNPNFIRSFYFDYFFNQNLDQKKKTNMNFYYKLKLIRFLLSVNFVPKAKIKIENPDRLKTKIFNLNFKYPIGLGPGIDDSGNLISNLQQLGFEFIEVGPVSTDVEFDKNNPEFILDDDSNTLLIKNIESPSKIENSIANIQREIFKIIKKSNLSDNNLYISTNLKLSEKSARTVPYMSDTLFTKLIKICLPLSDFAVINLSSYTNKTILQYKNPKKFEILLDKIKNEIFYEYGLKSIIDYELINKTKEGQTNLSNVLNLNYPLQIFKKTRTKVLLRLDTIISNEELENFIEIIKKNKIVEGIIIGGMIANKDNTQFICGVKNREISLDLLKRCFNLTKGEIPLISTGGILNGEDVYDRLKNGADFVLIYSPFILNGPFCLEKIIPELEEKMIKEGKASIKEIRNQS